ncbi:putative G-protein coupled receptor 141 [Oryzias melastigma]|uniref:Putative G-protein coupled receptor 141 n=1 Tax=Oryzias melastigma TaxID=30732 RepID=A0A834F6Q9_ORYME|nr:putative G-protein coupled receptor 141 [Oryzias melastigma]
MYTNQAATESTMGLSTVTMALNSTQPQRSTDYHIALVAIYSVVLLCGTASLSLMIHAMKYSPISTTSVAVLNLIFAHFIFLFTVPFRIYYYAVETWYLSSHWCRMVSAMIHMHMYMSLILYVIILLSRLLTFYNRNAQVSSFKRIHAVIGSVVVWIVVLGFSPVRHPLLLRQRRKGQRREHATGIPTPPASNLDDTWKTSR